jgi:anti-anti-sigma factor
MQTDEKPFEMRMRTYADVQIVVFQGELDMYNSHMAKAAVQAVIDRGTRKLLLNLSRVTYIDSSGIGILLYCHMTVKKLGLELRIVGMNRKVLRVMELTKLIGVLPVAENEREAVEAMGTKPPPLPPQA